MPTLLEKRNELDAKAKALHDIFEEAGSDFDMSKVKLIDGDSAAKALEIKKRNEELTALGKEIEGLIDLENGKKAADRWTEFLKTPVGAPLPMPKGDDGTPKVRSLGQILRESKDYATWRESGMKGQVSFELTPEEAKTLITLTTINVNATRTPGIVGPPEEERTIRDLMAQGTMDGNALTYMEETSNTPAADTRAEGVAKPEAALAFTERTDNARKIAVWIPTTTEVLADVPALESYIRARLTYFLKREEEDQLLNGDGTPPNISGILDRAIQTYAKGTNGGGGESTPDAIFYALQKVRNIGFAEPNAVVLNPNDWTPIRLLRTTDGIYIWGSPAEAGPERIWGKEIRQTSVLAENTGLVGAFNPHAQVFQREGVTITLSTEHASYFVENKVAILAEERLALAVYRPYAFCSVTGI